MADGNSRPATDNKLPGRDKLPLRCLMDGAAAAPCGGDHHAKMDAVQTALRRPFSRTDQQERDSIEFNSPFHQVDPWNRTKLPSVPGDGNRMVNATPVEFHQSLTTLSIESKNDDPCFFLYLPISIQLGKRIKFKISWKIEQKIGTT